MKKSLLVGLTCLLAAAPQLLSQSGNNESGKSRFWDYYDPYPSNYIGSSQWWKGEAFTGDWWGMRNMLDDSVQAV